MCAMLLPEVASFAAAMLFAVHPVHTEAVSTYCAYISQSSGTAIVPPIVVIKIHGWRCQFASCVH